MWILVILGFIGVATGYIFSYLVEVSQEHRKIGITIALMILACLFTYGLKGKEEVNDTSHYVGVHSYYNR